jgi:hypothetical protein
MKCVAGCGKSLIVAILATVRTAFSGQPATMVAKQAAVFPQSAWS